MGGQQCKFRIQEMAKVGEPSRLLVKAKSRQPKNRGKLETGHHTQMILSLT